MNYPQLIGASDRYSGFAPGEHTVPPDAKVVELKTCERCGLPFTREALPLEPMTFRDRDADEPWPAFGHSSRTLAEHTIFIDRGKKYCDACELFFLFQEEEAKKDPTELNLEPRRRSRQGRPANSGKYGAWKARLQQAMRQYGPRTAEQIARIIGVPQEREGWPASAVNLCYRTGAKILPVGHAWPKTTLRPRTIYLLQELL